MIQIIGLRQFTDTKTKLPRTTHKLFTQTKSVPYMLGNLDFVLRHATGLPVSIAEDALSCVALGTGRALEEMKTLKNILINMY